MSALHAGGFPEQAVRRRARLGAAAAFPPAEQYGAEVFGGDPGDAACDTGDALDRLRWVPPVLVPQRMDMLIDLGREPLFSDVDLSTSVGGLSATAPVYVSALGSTRAVGAAVSLSRQAARRGIPLVIGENVTATQGHRRLDGVVDRLRAYSDSARDGLGGVAVQQSVEDADAEVWNRVYTDPAAGPLIESGRLAFELKLGQGAKPGLGGMTLLDPDLVAEQAGQYATVPMAGLDGAQLRVASPGTVTAEILRHQVRMMRNNYPRARVWVKLHPGRDLREATQTAWEAGADAVTVDGAEGGTGWAPTAFLGHVGLPLAECLRRIGPPAGCLLASGRMWEGARAAKALAMGVRAVGLGRAALIAVDEDPDHGLDRLIDCLAVELQMLISAVGKYHPADVDATDVWDPAAPASVPAGHEAVPDGVLQPMI